jgi:hypothetical protein
MITATNITNTSDTIVYESDGESGITTLIICNHDSVTDAIVDVWVVPATGTPRVVGTKSAANQILKNLTIVAGDTFVMDMEKLVLDDLDRVIVTANIGNAVNCVISSMAIGS